jgi:5-methylthioribose kinase
MFHKQDAHWEDILGVEDYEMWCRLSVAGKKFYNVSDVLVKHRIHSGSAFNTEEHTRSITNIRERYGLS